MPLAKILYQRLSVQPDSLSLVVFLAGHRPTKLALSNCGAIPMDTPELSRVSHSAKLTHARMARMTWRCAQSGWAHKNDLNRASYSPVRSRSGLQVQSLNFQEMSNFKY